MYGRQHQIINSYAKIVRVIFKYLKCDTSENENCGVYTGEGRCGLCDDISTVKKCMICKKTFTLPLNRCRVIHNTIYKLDKTILHDKHDPTIMYICDNCYSYALMWEKAFDDAKENRKHTYE